MRVSLPPPLETRRRVAGPDARSPLCSLAEGRAVALPLAHAKRTTPIQLVREARSDAIGTIEAADAWRVDHRVLPLPRTAVASAGYLVAGIVSHRGQAAATSECWLSGPLAGWLRS